MPIVTVGLMKPYLGQAQAGHNQPSHASTLAIRVHNAPPRPASPHRPAPPRSARGRTASRACCAYTCVSLERWVILLQVRAVRAACAR